MNQFALNVLWITALLLPIAVFLVGPKLKQDTKTLVRALVAIACGWAFWVAYTIASQTITSGGVMNGAAYSFALMFGWFLPTIGVVLVWGVYWFFFLKPSAEKSTRHLT